jgi:hypothetical protein
VGIRVISEVGKVEHAHAVTTSPQHFLLEDRITVAKQAVDEHKGLERHDPVVCLCEPSVESYDTGVDVTTRERREVQHFFYVSVVEEFVMAACLH